MNRIENGIHTTNGLSAEIHKSFILLRPYIYLLKSYSHRSGKENGKQNKKEGCDRNFGGIYNFPCV